MREPEGEGHLLHPVGRAGVDPHPLHRRVQPGLLQRRHQRPALRQHQRSSPPSRQVRRRNQISGTKLHNSEKHSVLQIINWIP